jgi:enterochelin esterase-like enzyme
MQQKTILPFIVVGVWNGGSDRHMEYCPQKPVESLTAEQQEKIYQAVRPQGTPVYSGKVKSDRYLEFLVQELKPFIDSTYSTRPEAASTFVAGSSMGGMISWYAVCEYPQVFGGAACLSTHWPGIFTLDDNPLPQAFLHYLATHLPDAATHKLYFDFGTTTLDAMYEPLQNLVDELLKARGYTRENWRTQKFEGEPHSEEAWQKRLSIPLQFLLGPTN